MAVDVLSLWNFQDPSESEDRFRNAMTGASEHDRFVLLTQIARTKGLRGDWSGAREVLAGVLPHLAGAPEVEARYHLESGRTLCSPAHDPSAVTEGDRNAAREHYTSAYETARSARLDYIAIDALHMMTMVDDAPEDQINWNLKALDYLARSDQEEAKKWEGSLRNNLGYAYHLAGRYDDAIAEYEKSLEERQKAGKAVGVRIAKWMIARSLREKGDLDRALEIQTALEAECEAAGEPDRYVFEELEALYRAKGDGSKADHYRSLLPPS
ncbi:MAG: tetratricopeptide repeat protein [Armatimonadetes bacterium]|nr:tetratricopeptide repeat protein [Armatimonadota bacterium]